jgi:hypothetical protein
VENLDENLLLHHYENKMDHWVDQNEMVADRDHPCKERK